MAKKSTKKPATIKINVEDGAEKIPVKIIRHMSVDQGVNTLYEQMNQKDLKKVYKTLKKIYRAEKRYNLFAKIANKYGDKAEKILNGEE